LAGFEVSPEASLAEKTLKQTIDSMNSAISKRAVEEPEGVDSIAELTANLKKFQSKLACQITAFESDPIAWLPTPNVYFGKFLARLRLRGEGKDAAHG
jgi:hypothetical protein